MIDLNHYEQTRVVSKRKTGERQDVWDVSLEDTDGDTLPHSIITNGILTHNSDPDYLESVLRTSGATDVKASEVFGVKDSKGVTLVEPRIYYRDDNEGEKFFAWLAAIQRRMPDKRYVGGNWWYVYENTQKIKAALGDAVNVPMTRSANGGLYVPAEHGKPQLVVLLDSLPALLPEAADEDDPSKGIAIMARMFSTGMRAIKGRMRRKRVILVGVNQLSTNPMQMYGPKDSEKGGNALKYYSDSRTRFKARSSGMPYNPTLEGGIQREASAEFDGRKDTYRYIHVRNNKNKLGKPFRETWLRLWAEDGVGKARGYDPAWDCLSGDTLVTTDKGYIPIAEIPKYSKTVSPAGTYYRLTGIKALGHDGKMHKITAWADKGVQTVYSITTHSGLSVKATAKHEILVLDDSGALVWVKVRNLEPKRHYMLVSTKDSDRPRKVVMGENTYVRQSSGRGTNQFTNYLPKFVPLDENWAYVLGYLVADGYTVRSGFRLCASEYVQVQELERRLKCLGIKHTTYKGASRTSGRPAYEIAVSSVEITSILASFGYVFARSKGKRIPSAILRSPKSVQRAFLHGAFAGDSSKGDQVACYNSISHKLLEEMSLVMWGFGVPNRKASCIGYSAHTFDSNIGWCATKVGVTTRPSYPAGIGVTKAWEEKLPIPTNRGYNFTCDSLLRKRNIAANDASVDIEAARESVQGVLDAGFRFTKIKKIVKAGKESVFDIEVEKAHSFVANGLVVHNCLQYLSQTGQVAGVRANLKLNLGGDYVSRRGVNIADFKHLILGDRQTKIDMFKTIGFPKPVDLRKLAFRQLANGKAEDLYLQHAYAKKGKGDDDEYGGDA